MESTNPESTTVALVPNSGPKSESKFHPTPPFGGKHLSSVRKAREALRERAHDLLNEYINLCKLAAAAGDYETAQKGYQYLLDHMPAEEGERMVEISIDKPKQVEPGSGGPRIQVAVALGGLEPKKSLPDVIVIDSGKDPTSNG